MAASEDTRHLAPLALLTPLLEGVRSGSVTDLLATPGNDADVRSLLRPLAEAPDLSILWSVANVDRVDAALTAGSREWRLVYSATGGRINGVHLFEKPPPFAGVPGGRAIVVNGPSGAGKSSLIEAIVRLANDPWVAFDEPSIGTVDPAYLIWRDVAPSLHRGVFAAIAALAAEGNQVVLAAGGFSFDTVQPAFTQTSATFVGLDCPVDVLLAREAGRPGRWGGLAESSLGVHDGWTYDLRFDSSVESPEAMAAKTLAFAA